jgi:hypothetical protein
MQKLSTLYGKLTEKLGDDLSQWSEQNIKKFGLIPKKLLYCYFLPDLADK